MPAEAGGTGIARHTQVAEYLGWAMLLCGAGIQLVVMDVFHFRDAARRSVTHSARWTQPSPSCRYIASLLARIGIAASYCPAPVNATPIRSIDSARHGSTSSLCASSAISSDSRAYLPASSNLPERANTSDAAFKEYQRKSTSWVQFLRITGMASRSCVIAAAVSPIAARNRAHSKLAVAASRLPAP